MSTIFVCADGSQRLGDLESRRGAEIVFVEELCARPKQLLPLVPDDETSLVLAIHRQDARLGAIQSAVRQLGFDPLAVGIVDLATLTNGEHAGITMDAALARTSEFPGSVPEQVKLLPERRKTRRSFLSVGSPAYVGAPMIERASCVATDGCRICVAQCPVGALRKEGGEIEYDVTLCVACGICVTACPTGAVSNPAVGANTVEAEIRTLVEHSPGPVGVRYRCRGSFIDGESGWYQVEVPCTGMLTVGWLLAPLLLGAAEVDAVPCSAGGCDLRNDERLETTMTDAVRVLEVVSAGSDELPYVTGETPRDPWLSHGSTGRVLAAMVPASTNTTMSFDAADIGVVRIDPSTCTACELCAQTCPTDALASIADPGGVNLSFDPQSCVACGQCVTTCPEVEQGAIELNRIFDSADWNLGRREVRHEPTPMCEKCGRPVAPAAMLTRIEKMLGDEADKTMAAISRRCMDCRGR